MSETSFTPDQLRDYDEHDYVVMRHFFAPHELEGFTQRFLAIVNEELPAASERTVMRDVIVAKGVVRPSTRAEAIAKIQDFQNDLILYDGYVKHPRLLDAVEQFTRKDVKSIHTMLINKPPGVDGRHPFHQDLLYFPIRPADWIVGTWTALEPCTRENGCLVVLPGTHRGPLLPHENPDWEWVNRAYFGVKGIGAECARIHLEMEPGDTVFFHPVLIHGSGRNRTSGFRRAISAHYASAACRFLPGAEAVGKRRPYLLVQGQEHAAAIWAFAYFPLRSTAKLRSSRKFTVSLAN